jgi:hypothetical protein
MLPRYLMQTESKSVIRTCVHISMMLCNTGINTQAFLVRDS